MNQLWESHCCGSCPCQLPPLGVVSEVPSCMPGSCPRPARPRTREDSTTGLLSLVCLGPEDDVSSIGWCTYRSTTQSQLAPPSPIFIPSHPMDHDHTCNATGNRGGDCVQDGLPFEPVLAKICLSLPRLSIQLDTTRGKGGHRTDQPEPNPTQTRIQPALDPPSPYLILYPLSRVVIIHRQRSATCSPPSLHDLDPLAALDENP